MASTRTICLAACMALIALIPSHGQDQGQNQILAGYYDTTTDKLLSETLINDTIGARIFYNEFFFGQRSIIANVEGGHIWGEHEIFDRSGLTGVAGSSAVTRYVADESVTAQTDAHATMVGNVLAGTGYFEENGVGYLSNLMGVAPLAEMWSGAIATSFSSTEIGSFTITEASVLTPYRTFFRGIEGQRPDVINSSWGGGDPSGTSFVAQTTDALARENSTVAFVVAAGNGGSGAVSDPASGYNNIAVGSLGGANFLTPSEFSSRGAADFYNPETNITVTGVRAVVDIAAPGEDLVLAAYLGASGSYQYLPDRVQEPSPTDRYFVNESGTSFAAPIVAGGIALLKDVVHYYEENGIILSEHTLDTRVVKSVLMAGATQTEGWDNGQTLQDGVVSTTQSLDYATGAGALNLDQAAQIYLISETRDVAGLGGGTISEKGWDFGNLAAGGANEYHFANPFEHEMELTISLNWFAGTGLDENDLGQALSFANLNLEVWRLAGGVLSEKVAESISLYNNSEFLRIALDSPGEYAIRVAFLGMIYDLDPAVNDTEYAVAWQAVPEPATWMLILAGAVVLCVIRRRIIRV
ncbi:MAG: hypothetical protein BGO12_02910 [Verrucomicrobia bacterium 61-8]|nr:S8 family serine peptidase [Verrucomicrobiota bacterium]OJU98233.1 MAG: hypothetical protein BGO12_02910 [Verrucomicrobia bacterium 61-8]